MAIKKLPSSHKVIYNGTHGNLSVAMGKAAITAAINDEIVLFSLDIGTQLTNLTVNFPDIGASAKAKVILRPATSTDIDVTTDVDVSSAKVLNTDESGWFPTELLQEKHEVVIKFTGASVTNKTIKYRMLSESIGNA
ncbi:hypothetical protein [Vibrio sp. ER1A]|uniref:hypothetical protein n=1 Tax=Vibrio sp. ER1A TaxID=1517681 RepID=UPI0004DD25F6|nr:hypothetical protein [Vibrio sp. ER1A]KFA99475.1 hypothetical protein HW45_03700 [Vibrio sp. ER1A]